ncbi:amino acid adenylation domain-containing protein [Rhodococcus erythropolis]|uniref:non-ribosomal peptide synthetase n=1 Tax=Rhodococcus erythropolis TaxID=1833 RepID=UPI002949E4F3|nr:non-ribosomal peptide synthetase [Rhodococcus erythropolis]MDV6273696.1 amino acid adenylation domain-containing protein [Rhodococcus erythropolis]
MDGSPDRGIVSAARPDDELTFPLSAAQLSLLVAQQLRPEIPVSIAQYVDVDGPLDIDLLTAASKQTGREIGSGYLRLVEVDGVARQWLDVDMDDSLDVVDLRTESDPESAAREWMRREHTAAIDPFTDRLVRLAVLVLRDDHSYWYSRIHHVALDGFGAMSMMNRTAEIYTAAVRDLPVPPVVTAPLQALVKAESDYLGSTRWERDRDYWNTKMADKPSGTSLASSTAPSQAWSRLRSATVPEELRSSLERLAEAHDVTTSAVVIGALAAYLARAIGTSDVVLSLPVSGRTTKAARRSGGMMSNVVPIRANVDPYFAVGDVLHEVKIELTGALRHQKYRHEDLRRGLNAGDHSIADGRGFHGPLINLMLFHSGITLGDAHGELHVISTGPIEDLSVNVYQTSAAEEIQIDFAANPDLYTDEDVSRHHRRFLEFLELFCAAESGTRLMDIDPDAAGKWIAEVQHARNVEYWSSTLSNPAEELGLPVVAGTGRTSTPLQIEADLCRRLETMATTMNTSLFVLFQSAMTGLLRRVGSADEVSIGVSVRGYGASNPDDFVSMFANQLVLRSTVSNTMTLTDLVGAVDTVAIDAFEHADILLSSVTAALGNGRWVERGPLFRAMVCFEEPLDAHPRFPGLMVGAPIGSDLATAPELFVSLAIPTGEHADFDQPISGVLDWLGTKEQAEDLADRYLRILTAMVSAPHSVLGSVDLLRADARQALVPPVLPTTPVRTLSDILADRVRATPDAIAVVADDERVSYLELDRRSNRLARKLVDHGVQSESLVGIMLPKSVEMIVAAVAVLKAGGGYLPLDRAHPAERLAFVVEDAQPVCIISDSTFPNSDVVVVGVDSDEYSGASLEADERPRAHGADNLAYVIYTSGSTGRPKGVSVTHATVVRLFENTHVEFGFDGNDVWTMFHSFAFDFSVWELWGALLHGGTLVLVDHEVSRDPDAFRALVAAEGVTVLNQTPSAFYQYIEADLRADSQTRLRYVIFGGEALDLRRLGRWYDNHTGYGNQSESGPALVNMYGITETTVHVTHLELDRPSASSVTGSRIGDAIDGLRVYLLDEHLSPVPVGIAGEIYVAGGQLARGYLGRPDLTAGRFVADPFNAGGRRLYRSGDRARWIAPGQLEYLGRGDAQVKIRGFRIELGEIDSVILSAPGIDDAVTVVAPTPAGGALVTYVTASDAVDVEVLRAHAAEFLPTYMVPDAFMVIDSIPLTTNGKLDRRALPSPILASTTVFRPPTTPTEGKVAEVLADILGSGPLGLDDNFFRLGGNSLVATTAVARLTEATGVRMPLRALFDHPTVSGIAATIERAAQTPDADGIQVVTRPAVLPLAPAQQRLWFLNRVAPESGAYNIPLAVSLRGDVDADALGAAIVDVVTRHESLRTVFPQVGDNATQKVLGPGEGIAGLESIEVKRESLERVIFEFSSAGFDLVRERPVRYLLITVADDEEGDGKEGDGKEAVLVVVLHHMVADGWSLAPLAADLTGAYAARIGGNGPQWAPLPVQYADYALWHREHLGDAASLQSLAHSQIAFWKQRLAGAPEQLHLPTDRPRPLDPSMRGAGVDIRIGASTHQKLVARAAEHDATTFIALHACFALLLARYSATDDIVVGTPVAGRGDRSLDLLVGMFVNTLALRTVVDRDATFGEYLAQVRAVDVDAFDNADVPFDVVVDALELDRSSSHHPVFQAAITSRITTTHTAELAGVSMSARAVETGLTKFDLELTVTERREAGSAAGIDATFTYSTDLFDRTTVEALARNFVTLVESAVSEPSAPVGDLRVLGARESAATLPRRGVASVGESTLAQILGETALAHPDAIALEDSERSLSYAELERRSNRIARYLMDLGVGPETPVALAVARSVDSVLAVWAVTKAGGVFVPVDPRYPADRVAHMLEDSGVRIGIRSAEVAVGPAAGGNVAVWIDLGDVDTVAECAAYSDAAIEDADRTGSITAASAAYVIYTSGSTGVPKGTIVTHAGLANLAREQQDRYRITTDSRTLHFASPSFDGAVLELLLAGSSGATMVIAPPDIYGGDALSEFLRSREVTHAFITPAALATVDPEGVSALECIVVGGDVCTPELVSSWGNGRRLHNGYGPTETTVMVAISDRLSPGEPITIGGPIRGIDAVVLDARLQPVPIGGVGELYIGGPGLARGYHLRPALTSDRFVAHPYSMPGARMYRTGDLVRWTKDLALRYVGRSDHQLKIRGFRIELGEIDAALMDSPLVHFATTIPVESAAGTTLASYVLLNGDADTEPLFAALADRLPRYMIPSSITPIDAIPLTPVGKLDRRALPTPIPREILGTGRDPEPGLERTVADVFASLLDAPEVRAADSFFDLGGNSLVATQVSARLSAATGLAVDVRSIFEAPTVEALAARLAAHAEESDDRPALSAGARPDRLPLSAAQQRLWFVNRFDPQSSVYNIPFAIRITGHIYGDALEGALADVIARHEVLRTVYVDSADGPSQIIRALSDVQFSVERYAGSEGVDLATTEFAARGFDLGSDLPIRALLVREDADAHVLVVVIHHIAFDGWSLTPFATDFIAAYSARVVGDVPVFTPLDVQYADYALWQQDSLGQINDPESLGARELTFWTAAMAGAPDEILLPVDRPRGSVTTNAVGSVPIVIDAATGERLGALARRSGATQFMVVHAILAVVLARLGATDDVVIGTPVAGRGRPELDSLIGMFVNSVPLRTPVDHRAPFTSLLESVRDLDLAAFAHAELPFEVLVDALDLDRSTTRHPLFQVMLSYHQNLLSPQVTVHDAHLEAQPLEPSVAKFDLEFTLLAGDSENTEITGSLRFAEALFDTVTAESIAARVQSVARAVSAEPDTAIDDIEFLSTLERASLMPVRGPAWTASRTLAEILTRTATRSGESVALRSGDTTVLYRDLFARASSLARRLTTEGIGAEDIVAIAIPRSIDSIVALWGVALTGAAFVPVDPRYPADRILHMLTDSGATRGVTTEAVIESLPRPVPWMTMDDIEDDGVGQPVPAAPIRIDNLAYIIYTSGSTGKPKGVSVTHRGLSALAAEQTARYGISAQSRTLHFSSPSFDASILELLLAVGEGGAMVIATPDVYGGEDLAKLVIDHQVTHAFITPAALASVDPTGLEVLQSIVVGGEACSPELVSKWAPGRRLFNGYGPTETTVMVCISDALTAGETVTIGGPVRGVSAVVLDCSAQPVPVGVTGELYIAGLGLARGYLDQPALTATRFVAAPFGPAGTRMYRTGDLVRWTPHETIEYVGRSDHQVKVRGFRIELGEIDSVLSAYPGVEFAVTVGVNAASGETMLASYVVLGAEAVEVDELLSHARRSLPAFMVPSAITPIERVPLTPVGKLDRAALPEPSLRSSERSVEPLITETEFQVAGVVAELLGIEQISASDSFFELGGNSLLATRLAQRLGESLGKQVPVRMLFEHPEIRELAAALDTSAEAKALPPIAAADRPDRVPLSYAQARIWFLNQMDPSSPAYNVPAAISLDGALDVPALEAAVLDVIERHEILRTVFPDSDTGPHQVIQDAFTSLEFGNADTREPAELAREFASRGFDVTTQAPVRALLLESTPQRHTLVIVIHHIAADGWSIAPLMKDVLTAYVARSSGLAPQFTPLEVHYADFAIWQREALGAVNEPESVLGAQASYWRETLRGAPELIDLPSDRTRPLTQSLSGAHTAVSLPVHTRIAVEAVAGANAATPFMVLHAAYAVLLARLSRSTDIVIGSPVAGRGQRVLDDLVGMFVGTVGLRTTIDPGSTFVDVLRTVRSVDLDAFAHADIPFEQVVDVVAPTRTTDRHPVFQTMISFHGAHPTAWDLPGLTVRAHEITPDIAKYDLQFTVVEQSAEEGGGYTASLTYAQDLFDADTAASFAVMLETVVETLTAQPSVVVGDVDLVGRGLRALHGRPAGDALTLPELLLRGVADPHALALVDVGASISLTYGELDRRSDAMAFALIARGLAPEMIVALALPRSVDYVIALWAVAKAGGVFLPVDPAYPAERIEHMLTDSGAVLGITKGLYLAELPDVTSWIELDAVEFTAEIEAVHSETLPDAPLELDNPAYLIYTSGSTGKPKGVLVTHAGLAAFADEQRERFGVTPHSRTLSFASTSFDASVLELLLAFGAGATMVIAPTTIIGGVELRELLDEQAITHAFVTPAALATVDPAGLDHLEAVVVGGDACSADLVSRWAPGRRMFNAYGPTEATVAVTISDSLAAGEPVTIGGPIRGVDAMVLDSRLHSVPGRIVGELYVSGDGLARGYLGNPALTATRFVADPHGPEGARMYRTGDLVREDRAGSLVYLGRADHQVKVRGFRIELGEIDAVLASEASVHSAVSVVVGEGGDARIVAYVVPANGDVDATALRRHAAISLPAHMIPSAFVAIDAVPTTPAGKLDRTVLPAPLWESRSGRGPEGGDEIAICAAFAEVLDLADADTYADSSFFELGGNSLMATRLVAAIKERTSLTVPVAWIFSDPTPEALARRLFELEATVVTSDADTSALAVVLPLRPEGRAEPLFCIHPAIGLAWCYGALDRYVDSSRPLYGLQSPVLTDSEFRAELIEDFAARYVEEIRGVQPHGPYHLLGWSIGGLIAHAAAVQLQAAGESVADLILLDSFVLEDPTMAGAQPSLAELIGGLGISVPDADERDLTPEDAEELLRGAIGDHPLVSSERIERLFEEYSAGAELAHRYRPGKFVGDLLFFSAQTDTFDPLRTASAWRPFVSGVIIDRPVPTSHAEMFTEAGLDAIGPVINLAVGTGRHAAPDVDAELDALIEVQDVRG